MPQDNESPVGRGIQQILTALLIALMGWVAFSVITLQQTVAEMNVKLGMLIEKSKEIVPRAENERRYDALEKRIDQNGERVGRVEQQLMQKR